MLRIRNTDWHNDANLCRDLEAYVKRRYRRKEILCLMVKHYGHYAWSLRTLGNRLAFFNIRYIDNNVDLSDVEEKVALELKGPGCKLGYRAMTQKIREIHHMKVARDVIYLLMQDLDPEGLESRGGVGFSKKRKRTKRFVSKGPNCTMSLDGHDKLCGFQKSMFPLCIYGGQDCFSGRINFLRIWTSNNNPSVVARFYFEYIMESGVVPKTLRVDRGTETDGMTAMHCFIHKVKETFGSDDEIIENCIMYGPSTANKIERWWRELHHRMETFFKEMLCNLLNSGRYDPTSQTDRNALAYVFIPVIQKELDIFRKTVWNHSRGRKQKDKNLPTGIPDLLFQNPEQYDAEECGTHLTEDDLVNTADATGILDGCFDFLEPETRRRFEQYIPDTSIIEPSEASDAYVYLKTEYLKSFN